MNITIDRPPTSEEDWDRLALINLPKLLPLLQKTKCKPTLATAVKMLKEIVANIPFKPNTEKPQ